MASIVYRCQAQPPNSFHPTFSPLLTLIFNDMFIDIKILIMIKQIRECLHVTTWMNLEDVMLSEISRSQKRQIICESTYMRFQELSNSQRQNDGCQELERRGTGLMGIAFQFCKMERILKTDCTMQMHLTLLN